MRIALLLFLPLMMSWAAEVKLGKPVALKERTPIATVLAAPESHVGKTLQVSGRATEVCEKMGCWVNLADADGRLLRIKVVDGDIVFPKSAIGKTVVAEGVLSKFDLTVEQARAFAKHQAEEQGKPFHPESIKTGTTFYQLDGSGAVVID